MTFHGTEAKLIQLQSRAIGIPLLQKKTTSDGYEQEFKEAVRSLVPTGVVGMVFGDIYLQEHKDEFRTNKCRWLPFHHEFYKKTMEINLKYLTRML